MDGCGAPVAAFSLTGLARAFGRLTTAPFGSADRTVADAMRAHPEQVGGTGRDDTLLMQGIPGLLVKAGAEGVHAAALSDGRALALKISDGAERARTTPWSPPCAGSAWTIRCWTSWAPPPCSAAACPSGSSSRRRRCSGAEPAAVDVRSGRRASADRRLPERRVPLPRRDAVSLPHEC